MLDNSVGVISIPNFISSKFSFGELVVDIKADHRMRCRRELTTGSCDLADPSINFEPRGCAGGYIGV